MPIRGKSKTAENPQSALKSKSTKAKTSKATVPSGELPTGASPPATTGRQVSLPNIQFPSIFNTAPGGTMTPRGSTATATPATTSGMNAIAVHRRDLQAVEHGLQLSQFDPNQWMAQDLFTNSSPLLETSQKDADEAVLSIERKRQTMRIARANIGLNSDVVAAATEHQKLQGQVIDYATTLVDNQTKYIKYVDAGVKQQIAGVKLQQSQELHQQEAIALSGMQQMTPLIQEEWNERLILRRAKINSLKEQTLRANTQLAQKRRELEVLYNINEFQTI